MLMNQDAFEITKEKALASLMYLSKETAVITKKANTCLLVMDVREWEVKVRFILNSLVPQSEFQPLNQSMSDRVTVAKHHS